MSALKKLKRPELLIVPVLFATLAIGIILGTLINTGVQAQKQTSAIAPDATPLAVPAAVPISNEFSKLAKRVENSVVYIESDYLPKPGKHARPNDSEDENDGEAQSPKDPSDMFKRFFGKPEPHSFRTEGTGAGFIVDKNGYILTNEHVIDKADRIKVKLNGEDEEYRARVIGADTETDVAVLKIDAKRSLLPVEIGNSDAVEVGDWAIAIGSPFGLQATVTAGIVSATSRDLPEEQAFQHFLQTDAAINPGNSGGPLLNIRGEVIGINTMIATRSGSYEGIGFALPSNIAVKVYNDIIRNGRVVRGSIGIQWTKNGSQADTLHAFGIDHGVLVEIVSPDGPAAKAGIRPDDVIVAMNEKPVKDGDELVSKVADLPIGSTAVFTIDRNGKRKDYTIPIEERSVVWKDAPAFADTVPPTPGKPAPAKSVVPAKFGITIVRMTDKERLDLGLDDTSGVKIVAVEPGSFADDIGLEEGDAILSINRQDVATPSDVIKLQSTLKPGQPVAVHIARALGAGSHRTPPGRYYLSGRLPEN